MSDILCVTNRKLCTEDFWIRLTKLAAARPKGILLREKDLTEAQYFSLAEQAIALCREYGTPLILHGFPSVAAALHHDALHLPLPLLRTLDRHFPVLGASCHSVEDALEAQALGCTYITAGHIFDTDCKKGLPGRGTDFLRSVCEAVTIPVYAIGGICPENIACVRAGGAAGACVMGGAMRCENVEDYLSRLEERHAT
ncbi:MAG: thiamine phosphate synthase [Oscillospiraceae bacterium]|nr:thiamine phosphate synthase [Oscillospiraceae bacterium]